MKLVQKSPLLHCVSKVIFLFRFNSLKYQSFYLRRYIMCICYKNNAWCFGFLGFYVHLCIALQYLSRLYVLGDP